MNFDAKPTLLDQKVETSPNFKKVANQNDSFVLEPFVEHIHT